MNDLQIRQMQISAAKDEIRCCNELNQIYGLTLTEADITELVELRGQALRNTGRVEFGGGILCIFICKIDYSTDINLGRGQYSNRNFGEYVYLMLTTQMRRLISDSNSKQIGIPFSLDFVIYICYTCYSFRATPEEKGGTYYG